MSFTRPKSFYRSRMAVVVTNIITERKRQGIKQYQLSFRCGMNAGNMNKLESGYHSMTLTTLFRIADALEVSTEVLLRGALPHHRRLKKK